MYRKQITIFSFLIAVSMMFMASPSARGGDEDCNVRAPGFVVGVHVPVYPGSKDIGPAWIHGPTAERTYAKFQTADDRKKVADFYKSEMRRRGYNLFEFDAPEAPNTSAFFARKDLRRIDFFITREGNKTNITLEGAHSAGMLAAGRSIKTASQFGDIIDSEFLRTHPALPTGARLREIK